jgi:hypothetical protein
MAKGAEVINLAIAEVIAFVPLSSFGARKRRGRIKRPIPPRNSTLWEGRFKSCLVDSEQYLLRCYRCIELNQCVPEWSRHGFVPVVEVGVRTNLEPFRPALLKPPG